MSSRERVEAALRHEQPDRTPIFEYVLLSPMADHFLERPYCGEPANWSAAVRELGWENAVRRQAADRVDLALCLEHDLIYEVPSVPPGNSQDVPASGFDSDDDPAERVRRRNRIAREKAAAGPPDEWFDVYQALQAEMRARDVDLPLLVPAYEHGIWTDTDLMLTMLMDPDAAREHFALATRRSLAFVEKYLSMGIRLIGVGGDFAGNRMIISPDCYREYIVPEVAKVSRRIREAGGWSVNASDGDLWPVIDDFLTGCEVDCYLEIDFQAGMDLRRLKEAYGNRITFLGNLDCGNVLSFATPDEVRRHTIDCLEAGTGNGGHILTASNAITASVPVANYLAMIRAYRDYFNLPLLGSVRL